MRVMDHPNVVSLKHCFFSTTSTDELFLNLVMEYVPESMYRVIKHYSNANQRMPIIYVKLYMYQVCLTFWWFEDFWFIFSLPDNISWWAYRFSGDWRISTLFLEFATEIWSLKIYWFVYIFLLKAVLIHYKSKFLLKVVLISGSDFILCILQVDPLTHQVKLCDFGSAKMLVCWPPHVPLTCLVFSFFVLNSVFNISYIVTYLECQPIIYQLP